MRIDLYKDRNISAELNKNVGNLRTKGCDILDDLTYYEQASFSGFDQSYHVRSVLEHKNKKREYYDMYGKICDSHIEIEKLGVCRYAKPFTTILSLEDSLDYVLHRLTGASIDKIRSIPQYTLLSRSLLKLNYEVLDQASIAPLFGVDARLDDYLINIIEDSAPEGEHAWAFKFIGSLLAQASTIVEYASFCYKLMRPPGECVIRSKSFCSFVMTSSQHLEEEVILSSEGVSDYPIQIRSFGRKEYLQGVDLKYVNWGAI